MSDEHDAGGPHGMSATVVRLLATVAALAVALFVSSATTAAALAIATLAVLRCCCIPSGVRSAR